MPNGEYKRPDRVMTRGNEAVVIDYKFGKEQKSHKEQVEEYVKALKAMGYDTVKGYVWYVPTGKITRIDQ
jgi:RecB family exonuclease